MGIISRTPLREILQRLHYVGLVDWNPNIEIFVAPVDYRRVREIFDVRIVLKRTVVSLAATKATPGHLKNLSVILQGCHDALTSQNYLKFISMDARFREMMRGISENRYLSTLVGNAHNVCLRFWYMHRESLSSTHQDVEGLEKIFSAIKKGNPTAVDEAVSIHIIDFLKAFHAGEIRVMTSAMHI